MEVGFPAGRGEAGPPFLVPIVSPAIRAGAFCGVGAGWAVSARCTEGHEVRDRLGHSLLCLPWAPPLLLALVWRAADAPSYPAAESWE